MRRFWFFRVLAVVILIVFAFLLYPSFTPSTAHAQSIRNFNGETSGHPHFMKTNQRASLSPATSSPLTYHQGQVAQTNSTTYAIFWEPATLPDGTPTHVSATYNSLIQRYFHDIGGSTLYNNNIQYYDNVTGHIVNSSSLGAAWVDTSSYPASDCTDTLTPHGCLIDADIRAEIQKAMTTNNWNASLNNHFFVFTSFGEGSCASSNSPPASCFEAGGYCAYHDSFPVTGGSQVPVVYANIPYAYTSPSGCGVPTNSGGNPISPNNDPDADSAINIVSHEHMEIVTDPVPQTGWADINGNEIGDKCRTGSITDYGPITLDNGQANVQWNGNFYLVQREWSNALAKCTLAGAGPLLPGTAYITTVDVTHNTVNIMAFNTGDGTTRWSSPSFSLPANTPEFASPVLAGGLLYLSVGDTVYSVNPTTGKQGQSFATSGIVYFNPAIVNGVIYICSADGYVYAYSTSTGALLWKYQTSAINGLSPAVSSGVVYFGTNTGYLYALNASNGTLRWRKPGPSGFHSQPTVAPGVIYIGSTAGVTALKTSNGALLWDYHVAGTGSTSESVLFPPTVAKGVVYFGSTGQNASGGHIGALNASTGIPIWTPYATGPVGGFDSQPVLAGTVIYAGADGVYALNASNGTLHWHQQSRAFSTPTIVASTVISNSSVGIFALKTTDGSVIWSNSFCCNDIPFPAVVSLTGY